MSELHIHTYAPPGEVQHVADKSCWCAPALTIVSDGRSTRSGQSTVYDHSGAIQPSVRAELDHRNRFNGEMCLPATVVRGRGSRND